MESLIFLAKQGFFAAFFFPFFLKNNNYSVLFAQCVLQKNRARGGEFFRVSSPDEPLEKNAAHQQPYNIFFFSLTLLCTVQRN